MSDVGNEVAQFIRDHPWWNEDNEIADLGDRGDECERLTIHARFDDACWEYALVSWEGGQPQLLVITRGGKAMCQRPK